MVFGGAEGGEDVALRREVGLKRGLEVREEVGEGFGFQFEVLVEVLIVEWRVGGGGGGWTGRGYGWCSGGRCRRSRPLFRMSCRGKGLEGA